MNLLHDEPDFSDLLAVTGRARGIDPSLVEKDYWIMQILPFQRNGTPHFVRA